MVELENVIDNEFIRIEKLIYEFPIPLLSIENKEIIKTIDTYLPYSIGIEFECFQKSTYDIKRFKNIPYIMAVEVDCSEQRYRIPNGLKGLVCLYHICTEMKYNSELDLRSSNHYHFDFTDVLIKKNECEFENINEFINIKNTEFIFNELIKWETAFDLSRKDNWIRFFNPLGTLEIRIGEPTFEYDIIVKRLIDGCRISKYLKDYYNSITNEIKLKKLQEELKLIEEQEKLNQKVPDKEMSELNQIIKKRTFKI